MAEENANYDIISAISELLIKTELVGKRVYNDDLPLSEGEITCTLPAIVVSSVSGIETRTDCSNNRNDDTIQLTLRDNLNNPRKNIVNLGLTIKDLLRLLRMVNLGSVTIQNVFFRSSRYISEAEYNLRRYDIDCRIIYYYN